jgi:hypothetical protein
MFTRETVRVVLVVMVVVYHLRNGIPLLAVAAVRLKRF